MKKIYSYLLQVAIAFDQLINAIFGGYPDETLSSRCYRKAQKYWYAKAAMWVLDIVLTPIARNHCKEAYESELTRRQNFPYNGNVEKSTNKAK